MVMVTLPKFTRFDYAHMPVCATATYRLLPGMKAAFSFKLSNLDTPESTWL